MKHMAKDEKPTRLAPTWETLRELYLKSGNQCAFPSCTKVLFNAAGVFVGQICHIEAAAPGGERFNSQQTNEERRHVSNLILMCYDHHVETNKVDAFPVEKMRHIKEEHERKFSDVIGTMLASVVDHTTLSQPTMARSLEKINASLGWNLTLAQLAPMVQDLEEMAGRMSKVPVPARQLFEVVVNRSNIERGIGLCVSGSEVQQATGLRTSELRKLFAILDKYGLTFDGGTGEFGVHMVGVSDSSTGWPVWQDVLTFTAKDSIKLRQIIVSLDFSMLD
jgi:hypothetical protein